MDWISHPFDHHQWLHLVAQTTADELEILKAQYANLDTTFERYLGLIERALTIAGIAVTAVLAVAAWFFRKSLTEFHQTLQGINAEVEKSVQQKVELAVADSIQNQQATIETAVQQRVQREVGLVVRSRIDRLEDVLKREAILSTIKVDYILPVSEPQSWPQNLGFLLKVLESRGFQTLPRFIPAFQTEARAQDLPLLTGDVVVLDLENAQVSDDQRDRIIRWVAQKVPFQRSTLVVYSTGRHPAINELPAAGHYCVGANSPLSLVGHAVNAAYIADVIKRG